MRLSQFTIFVPDFPSAGDYTVFNTFNQATIVVNQRVKDMLANFQGSVTEDNKKYIEAFKNLGFIVDENINESEELMDWYDKARSGKSAFRATILTTYDCNFACEYCVEEGVKKSLKMDEEHAKATVNWLINRLEEFGSNDVQLMFYGGEPLMNTHPIEYISSKIYEYSEKKGITFSFTITSNGSLLKPALVDRLVPYGLKSVKITIDGDKEAHDSKRPFKGGKGSYDTIIKNILQVADKVKVRIGTNVDLTNMGSVPSMLEHLEQLGLKDKIDLISFSPIVRIENEDGTSRLKRQLDCSLASNDKVLDNLTNLTWEAYNRGFKTLSKINFTICSMNRDGTSVVIDPVGRVYTCPAFVGREGFQTGDIYHPELFDKHDEFMNLEIPDECFKCAYMPMCGGGCRHVAYIRNGDVSKTICEKAHIQKAVVETLKMQILSEQGLMR